MQSLENLANELKSLIEETILIHIMTEDADVIIQNDNTTISVHYQNWRIAKMDLYHYYQSKDNLQCNLFYPNIDNPRHVPLHKCTTKKEIIQHFIHINNNMDKMKKIMMGFIHVS